MQEATAKENGFIMKSTALPSTVTDLMESRKNPLKRTLNDQVEQVVLQLWADEEFRGYIDAVHNAQALEGSLMADDLMAAMIIRRHAKEGEAHYVAKQKLDVIRRSMIVVLRRYKQTRKERREA